MRSIYRSDLNQVGDPRRGSRRGGWVARSDAYRRGCRWRHRRAHRCTDQGRRRQRGCGRVCRGAAARRRCGQCTRRACGRASAAGDYGPLLGEARGPEHGLSQRGMEVVRSRRRTLHRRSGSQRARALQVKTSTGKAVQTLCRPGGRSGPREFDGDAVAKKPKRPR